MKVTLFQIKVIHTVIFFLLSGCVLLIAHAGLVGSVSVLNWVAMGLVFLESVVLVIRVNYSCRFATITFAGSGQGVSPTAATTRGRHGQMGRALRYVPRRGEAA